MDLADDFRSPKKIKIGRFDDNPKGEDDQSMLKYRLLRDGWRLKQKGVQRENKRGSKIWWEYTEPMIWTKTRGRWTIESHLKGTHERDGPLYVTDHFISDANGQIALRLGRSDWADWSRSGEVLFARQGRLFRIIVDSSGPGAPEELIDLRDLRFEPVKAPPEALKWDEEIVQRPAGWHPL